jgi:CHAD domain-containing protein
MRARSFLHKAGRKRLERLLVALEAAARRPVEGPVHDLRVAIRRLLAFLALAEGLAGGAPPLHRPLPDALDALMRPLGRLRDAHVKLLRIRALAPHADPCTRQYWLAVLSDSEKWEAAVARTLAGTDPRTFRKAFGALPLSPLPEEAIGAAALAQLQARESDAARLAAAFLEDRTARSLHALRLAFKRYRYTAEALSSLLPGLSAEAGSGMHGFQTLLGDIRDCDVLLAESRRFREKVLEMPGAACALEIAVAAARDEYLKTLLGILQHGKGIEALFVPGRTPAERGMENR